MAKPATAQYQLWTPGRGQDPAKYLVNPGQVLAPGKHAAGNLRHSRHYLANGSKLFVFPVGVESFRRSGQATLGVHKYLGDHTADGITVHYEEARIELSGTFPGITSQDNMVNCIAMLRSKGNKMILYAPGVFEREQYVLPENWDFTHQADDRTHSIDYSISFLRIGEGQRLKDPKGTPAPPNPTIKTLPKGKTHRIFTVKDNARTFRVISNIVYGNSNQWQKLVTLNQTQLTALRRAGWDIPSHQYPTYRWPIGTKFRY